MKKVIAVFFILVFSLAILVGCNNNDSLLNPTRPVTLTMWHVYGEQADSPMNRFVEKFNRTVG